MTSCPAHRLGGNVNKKTSCGAIALIVSFLCAPATAGDWTKEDTEWQAAYLALHIADWGQTRDAAAHPGRYVEQNPILGEHPARAQIDKYFVATALLHTGIAYVLPPDWRRAWQQITIGFEVGVVARNARIGLQVNF